jgi:hypothetical protein
VQYSWLFSDVWVWQESSLAGLMHPAQREATADVVNAALLAATRARCSGPAAQQSNAAEPRPQARHPSPA